MPHYAAAAVGLIVAGCLLSCDARPALPTKGEIRALAEKMKNQMVLVKGGDYQTGDFGQIHSSAPCTR